MILSSFSLYTLEKMDKQLLKAYYQVVKLMFIDIILIQDLCQSFEEYCMPNCKNHLLKDEFEFKYNGVNAIFKLGGISNLDHQEQLEDLTYQIIENTRNLNFSLEQRAIFICKAWLKKITLLN